MGGLFDPQHASIDSLIGWLREQRRRDPCSPLSSLLANKKFDDQRIVDIACIDLMERRRQGHAVSVESYVEDFDCIRNESNLLDLIDAEICVASELGEKPQPDDYAERFPDLADQVSELVRMDAGAVSQMTPALADANDRGHVVRDESNLALPATNVDQPLASQSGDFSMEVLPHVAGPNNAGPNNAGPNNAGTSDAGTSEVESAALHPIDLPEWFVDGQCVASGPGRWLIRGRDTLRGVNLALKVAELPPQLTKAQSEQLLDACESAAKVRNNSWVLPSVAAIQKRHLGVIRPWVYGRTWQQVRLSEDHRTQLRNLASVAFAVAAAHQVGATHGGLHVENLMVDHEGRVQILDATASRVGLQRWLSPTNTGDDLEHILSLQQRIDMDVQDLIKLVAAASVEWDQEWALDLLGNLRQLAATATDEACALIGQELVQHADVPNPASRMIVPRRQRSWRTRLARWWAIGD